MIRIENADSFGWEAAIRGMRNPMNSWDKSDGFHGCELYGVAHDCNVCREYDCNENSSYMLGDSDKELAAKLAKAGTEHRKYLRMVHVQMDVTAPLYWWKEFDTYKVGTVANSCSTMHKIHAKPFELEDFSHEHLFNSSCTCPETTTIDGTGEFGEVKSMYLLERGIIAALNFYRSKYLETGDKDYWWQMIQLLPSSYNQRRTIDLNYEVLANMYRQRRNHKLDEWREFCGWIETLPYSELITGEVRDV